LNQSSTIQNNFLKVEKPGKLANDLNGYKKKNKPQSSGWGFFSHGYGNCYSTSKLLSSKKFLISGI